MVVSSELFVCECLLPGDGLLARVTGSRSSGRPAPPAAGLPPGSAGARVPGHAQEVAWRRAPRAEGRRRAAQGSGCVAVGEEQAVAPLTVGRIASLYYLKHQTMAGFTRGLQPNMAVPDVRTLLFGTPGP